MNPFDSKARLLALGRLTGAVLTIAILAIASLPSTAGESDKPVERVGVLAVAGDRLLNNHVGKLVFGNRNESFDIRDWGLEEIWEAKIAAAVQSLGGFEVIDVDLDRTSLYGAYSPEQPLSAQERRFDYRAAMPELRRIAVENQLDAIILLVSYRYEMSPLIMEGVTLGTEKTFAGPNAYFWLATRLDLIDGATGEVIASRKVGKGGRPILERVTKELRAKRFAEYSPEDAAIARDRFAVLPDPYWEKAIAKLMTDQN
jgi:hypothetical protein